MPRATEIAHQLVRPRLRPGDVAIDATAGNGHDTLFLAEAVGPTGKVFAFDIQAAACEQTRRIVSASSGELAPVEIIRAGHETMAAHIPVELHGRIATIMFNLGYLPGGDKTVITHPQSTLAAIESALTLLRPEGILSVVAYPGHVGGGEEAVAVFRFLRRLDAASWHCFPDQLPDLSSSQPFVLTAVKLTG